MNNWILYVLSSDTSRRTYTGVTNNFIRRIRQHNGELKGGAKATRNARPWSVLFQLQGLDKRTALRLEWRMHHCRAGNGIKGRSKSLINALYSIEIPDCTLVIFNKIDQIIIDFLPHNVKLINNSSSTASSF